jgi:hypothetical protein
MRATSALAILVLAACASSPSTTVRDGDPATVNRDCKLLGTVNGVSMFGSSDETRVRAAMNDAREKAAKLGATDVIFLTSDTSGMLNRGNATARAYRCPT